MSATNLEIIARNELDDGRAGWRPGRRAGWRKRPVDGAGGGRDGGEGGGGGGAGT